MIGGPAGSGADDDAAVDAQDFAGDVARFVRGEEQVGVGDVAQLAQTAERDVGLHAGEDVLRHGGHHLGGCEAGGDGGW